MTHSVTSNLTKISITNQRTALVQEMNWFGIHEKNKSRHDCAQHIVRIPHLLVTGIDYEIRSYKFVNR